MPLHDLTIHEAHDLLKSRQISSVELTEAVLRRIEEVEPKIRAYITITPDVALAQAREADARLAAGEVTPLTGIPAGIKDILCTAEVRTTAGSRMLEDFIPPYEATVVTKLKRKGLVMVGKLNQDEFAMGSSTENSAFFPTRNPWDTNRVPGGSSGGSAAAVPAGEALYTLGTDTGGSIRQPASLCGVTGMKPTYGRVSRYGLIAFASSLDQIGPFTKDVEDSAIVLNAIAGHDSLDSTSQDVPVPDYTKALVDDLHGLRLGIPREYFIEGLQPGVKEAVQAAIAKLGELGAQMEEVSLPHTKYALPTYYIIAPAEASANLARYDGVKYGYSAPDAESMWDGYFKTRERGFGPEVKRRIMLGTYALSAGYYDAYYLKAQKVRTLIKQDFDRALERIDALVAPVSPTTAFELGARTDDPLQMYLSDVLTIPVNMAGIAAVSIPCGFADGLPVGLQIIAKPFGEETLLRVGYAYQQHTDWHRRKPEL